MLDCICDKSKAVEHGSTLQNRGQRAASHPITPSAARNPLA